MELITKVNYTYSDKIEDIKRKLESLPDIIACDFEAKSKWTEAEKEEMKQYLIAPDEPITATIIDEVKQYIKASGLSHPSFVDITHLSIATSETEAFVAILPTQQHKDLILDYLVNTKNKQLWHNACYDLKLVNYYTKKFPIDFEDTEVMATVLLNHCEDYERKTGLKHLMGYKYGDWAVAKDVFEKYDNYDETFIKYAAIDACATFALYNEMMEFTKDREKVPLPDYDCPLDYLPLKHPKEQQFKKDSLFFYEKVAKPLIKDTIRIMLNGIALNMDKVTKLEKELDKLLTITRQNINNNPIVINYNKDVYPHKEREAKKLIQDKMRDFTYYLKSFDYKDILMRSIYIEELLKKLPKDKKAFIIPPIEDLIPTLGIKKWTMQDIKRNKDLTPELENLAKTSPIIDNTLAKEVCVILAMYKADTWNKSKKYEESINNINYDTITTDFNPASATQKRKLFKHYGFEPLEKSKKTKEDKWDRKAIENLKKISTDKDIIALCDAFIDFSYGNIIATNFIPAFHTYTVDGRLRGSIKLLGAKSGRYTSNKPNLFNMPSTGSIYSKPVKECFIAPKGKIILSCDLSALEDRVLASLTEDEGKCGVFEAGLDGHSYNTLGYYPEEVEKLIGKDGTLTERTKKFMKLVDQGNKEACSLRQKSKPNTFRLAYGGFPNADKGGTITQQIFDNYHNVLYANVTKYKQEHVIKTTEKDKRLHLGMGFYIKSNNVKKNERTLGNGICQFQSILTALTINKYHSIIDKDNMQDSIKTISSIYDSIYYELDNNVDIIKKVNDELIPLITKDYIENQRIPNEAECEIGYDWANMIKIKNNATKEEIQEVLNKLQNKGE